MKKFMFVFLNIIAVILLLVIADCSFFALEKAKFVKNFENFKFFDGTKIVHFAKEIPNSSVVTDVNRSFYKNNDKAIILLGCSYTFGGNLEPNQTFSYYLSEQTNRTVYNLGVNGGAIQQALYMANQPEFAEKYPNVDLIIYTYIPDHLKRNNKFLSNNVYSPACNFRLVKSGDDYVKADEWYANPSKIYLFRFLLGAVSDIKNSIIFNRKNCDNFADMVNMTHRRLKKLYPNSKFVFMFYQIQANPLLTKKFDKDIYYFSTYEFDVDLDSAEFRHGKDWHPTERVWQETVPRLLKRLEEVDYI